MTRITLAELIAKNKLQPKKNRANEEHLIQCSCFEWFNLTYPEYRRRLFAVPNGGKRDKITASNLADEGVTPGVSDLIFLKRNRQYGALLIEMKAPKRYQSPDQKLWQKTVCSEGEYKYVVCKSREDFIREVMEYLSDV